MKSREALRALADVTVSTWRMDTSAQAAVELAALDIARELADIRTQLQMDSSC